MKPQLTLEAFAEFCERKPAEEKYNFHNICGCAIHQYFTAIGLQPKYVGGHTWVDKDDRDRPLSDEYRAAVRERPHTFGALAARLRAAEGR